MKKRSARIHTLVRLASIDEQQHGRRLYQMQNDIESAKMQLGQIQAYEKEYMTQLSTRGVETLSVWCLQDYYRFLQNLSGMIANQRVKIANFEKQYSKQKDSWLQAYNKLQALKKLEDKAVSGERQVADKREQKLLDEYGQQLYNFNKRGM